MKKQLLTLQQLLAIMDPQLYWHLGLYSLILENDLLVDLNRLACREGRRS